MTIQQQRPAFGWMLGAVALLGSLASPSAVRAQDAAPVKKSPAWTLEEAQSDLRFSPSDPYLNYVVMQLARRNGVEPPQPAPNGIFPPRPGQGFRDARQTNMFDLFSGALAVQESLQMERMLALAQGQRRPQDGGRVPLSRIPGPTLKGHPWEQMLAGQKPELSPLAQYVPNNYYFVEFRSLSKMLDLLDQGDLWGRHLYSQADQDARTHLVGERLRRQLAVETSALARPFYDKVVAEVALTGSDLYVREGSDLTLIFRHRSADVFQTQMNGYLNSAAKSRPDATRTEDTYLGIPYVHVTTPDREVHVFSAYIGDDLHVRSNSSVSFRRVLAAMQGRDEQNRPVATLAQSTEFAYIRTLMKRGAPEEDGFIYLSDPFIRHLVGPQLRLTEAHRLECYNQLRMLGHAALLHRTETGRAPRSIEDLKRSKCLPAEFGDAEFRMACPDGGTHTLSADGMTGVCSHHGHAGALCPCCEIPLESVTEEEARAYGMFLEEYNQYWRTFFDPIAIRVQATPQRYRLETIVLPLIDNSIYTGLATVLGGPPEQLDALPVPPRSIFSLAAKLDKPALLASMGLSEVLAERAPQVSDAARSPLNLAQHANSLRQIALAMHNYHDTYRHLPQRCSYDGKDKPLLSWRVHLLPFMDEDDLYEQFHLDEPWDSAHNKKLLARIPAAYKSANAKLAAAGKTCFVVPVGRNTVFPKANEKVNFAKILDGTSNTVMAVVAPEENAVEWTKPDDWEVDFDKPFAGMATFGNNESLLVTCDGAVHLIRRTEEAKAVQRLFVPNDGEPITFQLRAADAFGRNSNPFGLDAHALKALDAGKFLLDGIGNQVGFHVYDSPQMFSLSLPGLWGSLAGTASRRGSMQDEMLVFGTIASSLTSPVYVAIPVKDKAIVDNFLERLDEVIGIKIADSRNQSQGFIRFRTDFYHARLSDGSQARSFGVELGPVKWRFFWARIGDGLYVASKPEILEDFVAIQHGKLKATVAPANATVAPANEAAHGLIRLRPENWRDVLPSYQLGWAENHRQACLENLGPLSHIHRALGDDAGKLGTPARSAAVENLAARIHGARCFCPDGGRYETGPEGRVSCSVHGTRFAGQQALAPSAQSQLGRLPLELRDVQVSLKFLEDGLHAIVTIDRK